MENENKKPVKNIINSNEKLLLSDVIQQSEQFVCQYCEGDKGEYTSWHKWKVCPKCNGTGYKGRVAICEAVLATKEVGEIITMNPSEESVKQAARSQNILDMKQDGVIKILKGISTFDELGRVIDLEIKI